MKILRTALLTLAIVMPGLMILTGAAGASNNPATVNRTNGWCNYADLWFTHPSGAYTANAGINCSATVSYADVYVYKNGSPWYATRIYRSTPAGAFYSFVASRNTSYQIVEKIYDSRGTYLGFATSGAPLVIK